MTTRTEAPRAAAPAPSLGRAWVLGLPLVCALLLAVVWLLALDTPLVLAINRWPAATAPSLWTSLTLLGDSAMAAALLLPFALRRPQLLVSLFVAALLGTLVGRGLTLLFPVDRPPAVLDPGVLEVLGPRRRHHAFPSGHTTTAFLLAGLVAPRAAAAWQRWLLLGAAALVGCSRVAIGVHWPTDVLAGAAIGWLAGLAGVALAPRWTARCGPRTRLALGLLLVLVVLSLYVDRQGFDSFQPVQLVVASLGLLGAVPGLRALLAEARAAALSRGAGTGGP